MKISPISNVSFKKCIKVSIEDKSLNPDGYKTGSINKVMQIAFKNNSGLLIGEDVIILNSNSKIKGELGQLGYNFEEIGDVL